MNGRSTNAAAEEAEEQETAGASISGESGAKEELNEGGHMIGTDASTIETARSNVDKEVIIPTEPSKKSSNESEVEMTDVDQKLTEEEKTEKQIEVETQLTDPDQDPTEMEKIKEAIVEAEVEMTGINQEPVSNVRPAEESEDVILCTVYNVLALQTKILETDGRIKNPPHFNAWKTFRCQRNNQDMGSLFELREEYYVWKHPK